jgi:hypothetical protein
MISENEKTKDKRKMKNEKCKWKMHCLGIKPRFLP